MALEFACKRVGFTDRGKVAVADTAAELLEAVAQHAREAHHVELNGTLIDDALTTVREV